MKPLAQIISVIFHPIFIPLYCAVIFINSMSVSPLYPARYKIIVLATIAVFTCIIPILYMFFRYITGSIPNLYVEDRVKRTPIYLVSFASYIICAVLLVKWGMSSFFMFIFFSSLIAVLVIAVINLKWKISAHSCGAGVLCGAVFTFEYFLYTNSILLFCTVILIVGLVMTSRLALKVHTLGQVTAGFFVGLLFSAMPVIITFIW